MTHFARAKAVGIPRRGESCGPIKFMTLQDELITQFTNDTQSKTPYTILECQDTIKGRTI
jgi:hypothetical protein